LLERPKARWSDVIEERVSQELICGSAWERRLDDPEVARSFKRITPLPRVRSGFREPFSRLDRVWSGAQHTSRRDISMLCGANSSIESR
jgi:hypothetical protein